MAVSKFRSLTVSSALIAAMANLASAPLDAGSLSAIQEPAQSVDAGRVENTQVVINGGIVSISYDLIALRAQSTFDVELEASLNGGRTYDLKPKTVTGDVGLRITPGVGKKIVWEAPKDTDSLQVAQYNFRVVVKAGAPRASQVGVATPRNNPAPPPAQPRVPAAPPAGTPPPSQQPGPGGHNSMRWPGIGMIAGGGALAAMGAWGPLKQDNPAPGCAQIQAQNPTQNISCATISEASTVVIWSGIGAAVGGAIALALGHRASKIVSVAPASKGFLVYHVVPLDQH